MGRTMTLTQSHTFTRSQVAELFGVSPHTVTRWAKEGRLPAVTTLGGQRRYSREVILRLMEDMEHGTPYPRQGAVLD